jgi:hypothetical protein
VLIRVFSGSRPGRIRMRLAFFLRTFCHFHRPMLRLR